MESDSVCLGKLFSLQKFKNLDKEFKDRGVVTVKVFNRFFE